MYGYRGEQDEGLGDARRWSQSEGAAYRGLGAMGGSALPVVSGPQLKYNGVAGAPAAPPGTILGVDPANPSNFLMAGQPGYPPRSIPQVFNGLDTSVPGYGQDAASNASPYPSNFYDNGDGTFSSTPGANASTTMAQVIAAAGTAAGVWQTATAAGINVGGNRYTLHPDGTFSDDYGHSYSASDIRAMVQAAGTAGVELHVDTVAPVADPAAPPNGWRLGSYLGTQGYWGPDGKFYAGKTPWLNPSAVGTSINTTRPATVTSGPPPAAVYTNPDGTPTYNGHPYSATDFANPFNNAGTYVPGGVVGPPTPGGGQSGPMNGGGDAPPPGGFPIVPPMTITDQGGMTPPGGQQFAPLQASVAGGISTPVLIGAAIVGFLLLRRR